MQAEQYLEPQRSPRSRCLSRLFLMGCTLQGIFLTAALLLVATGCEQKQQVPTAPPPRVEVEVTSVIRKDVPLFSEWIGTTEGLVNATIRAQVTGYLLKQAYKEGSFVRKGDLLFEIDPRTFKAALDQAEGQLAQAKARLGKTELDVKRYTPLARESAISQQELDDAVQANLAAKAGIQSAQAEVDQAKLNFGFTRVASPIDGVAGTANAQIGDLVGPGQSGELTTVSTVDPIKVTFPISEQEYMSAAQEISKADGQGQDAKDHLELILADGSVFPQKGKYSFADRQVDVKTGTIRIAARFPNPGNILRPGQYARVRAQTGIKKGALLIPQRAVTELQGGYQVAVVGADSTISIRPVKASDRVDSLWVIDEGLKPGETVVVEGTQKVRDGQLVTAKPSARESLLPSGAASSPEAGSASPSTSKKD